MRFLSLVSLSISLLLLAPSVGAQSATADSLRARALAAYREKSYAESATAYSRLAARAEATPVDLYNAACSAVLAGDTTAAFDFLDRALAAGFDAYDQVSADPDLAALRASPRWHALATRVDSLTAERTRLLASLPDPFKAFGTLADRGYLPTVLALETMRREHPGAPMQWRSRVAEALGWTQTMVGEEREAIAIFDSLGDAAAGSVPADFGRYTPRDAVREILARARETRIVMINEAHHVSMHRALTAQLLPGLWKAGYRYLAVEAVGLTMTRDSNATPTMATGTYTKDPVFADMLRAAVKLGFTVVPYDTFAVGCVATAENPGKCFSARDSLAAGKLHRQIFAHDPRAKVIVHAGYSHVVETVRSAGGAKPVAYWLTRLTGVDPLTVDQTVMYARSSSAYEPPEYRSAEERGWLTHPVVLRDAKGKYYRSAVGGFSGVDMQVFTPRATTKGGRPDWLFTRLGRRGVPLEGTRDTAGRTLGSFVPATEGPYLVQAFVDGEGATAIPFDQLLVAGGAAPSLALDPGRYELRVVGESGEVGRTRFEVRGSARR